MEREQSLHKKDQYMKDLFLLKVQFLEFITTCKPMNEAYV